MLVRSTFADRVALAADALAPLLTAEMPAAALAERMVLELLTAERLDQTERDALREFLALVEGDCW